jgi:apoptosis-inducing factor 2
MSSARATVAVIGGGYGGIAAAKALDAFADVTLVEPRDAFVHNVAALRALVDPEWLPTIFLPYDHLLANGRVVRDRAAMVDSERVVLASGGELRADFVVLATGSSYPFPAKSGADETAAAIGDYRRAHEALARAARVLVLGAGPTGLELAGEISERWPDKRVIVVEPAATVLAGPYADELREELLGQLRRRGVDLIVGDGLAGEPESMPGTHTPFRVATRSGRTIEADIWFRCYGIAPVSDYLGGDLAASRRADGTIEVNDRLQVEGQSRVFALGDVAAADMKGAGRAGRQAEVVAANIRALIDGGELQPYEPLPPVIVIPLGPTGGASQLPGQSEIAGAEATASMKGEHMFVGRYRQLFGLDEAAEGE